MFNFKKLLLMAFCLFFLEAIFFAKAAIAKNYKIEIRQIDPDSWTYNSVCSDQSKDMCHVFIGILPQSVTLKANDLELDVSIFFHKGVAHFQFKSGNKYFLVSENEKQFAAKLPQSEPGIELVKLYVSSPMAKDDPDDGLYQLPVVRPKPEFLAELEIAITPK